jgi:hypothetical protein
MVSVIMVSVIMVSVFMLSVIMLSVIMLSVIMLSVIMLSVVAPQSWYLDISSAGHDVTGEFSDEKCFFDLLHIITIKTFYLRRSLCPTLKYSTVLERLARDKCLSLFFIFVGDEEKPCFH